MTDKQEKTVGRAPEQSSSHSNREHFSKLGSMLVKYITLTKAPKKPGHPSPLPPVQGSPAILLFLKPFPYLLLSLFIFSFFWDFNGIVILLLGTSVSVEGLLRIVSVSGLIGFLTNWIAITMLFRPLKKRPLLGQGLIPAHKERIATRLALAVSEDLINPELIRKKIDESQAISRYRELAVGQIRSVTEQQAFREDLKAWLTAYVNSLVQNSDFRNKAAKHIAHGIEHSLENRTLEKAALKTYSFLRGQNIRDFIEEALDGLPLSVERNIRSVEKFLDELPDKIDQNHEELDQLISNVLFKLVNQLDVYRLVEENLREYDEQRLETMIKNATNEQLKTIQYLGAVLGTIGGFVIWQPLYSLAVLGALSGSVYLADRALDRK